MLHTPKAWVSKGQKIGKRMLWSHFNFTRRKSLFHIDGDKRVHTRTRGELHHSQTPALVRSAI